MAQLVLVNDKVADTVNKIGTNAQVVSAVSRSIVNSNGVVTLTVPTGTIVADEDTLTLSHVPTANMSGVAGSPQVFVIGQ